MALRIGRAEVGDRLRLSGSLRTLATELRGRLRTIAIEPVVE